MKKYIIPFILLVLLFGCIGGKPHLSVSLSKLAPSQPYEGDAVSFNIVIVNSGSAEAKEFIMDFMVNNASLKTDVLTLAPNSNTTLAISWFPFDAGVYDISAKVDTSNVISEPSTDKEARMQLSVSPSEQIDVFSLVPDKELLNVGTIDVNNDGLKAVYSYSQAMSELPQYFSFLRPYIKNLKEVNIGTADYADASKAMVFSVRGVLSVEQISSMLSALTGAQINAQNKSINGVDVFVLSTGAEYSLPFCIWREKGRTNLVAYQELKTSETCENIIEKHNSSYARGLLSASEQLARHLPFNATLLGVTEHISNLTRAEYGAAFEDEEGFYGFYVAKEPYVPQNNTCSGRISNRSQMQTCELMPTENSTLTWVQRKVGDYSIACISIPKGEASIAVEMKALDICYAFNFSGEERTWVRPIELLNPKKCEFPDVFACASYDFSNSTLKLNLTQSTGRRVVLRGFKCTAEESVPTQNFQFKDPIILESNSSVMLNSACYDKLGNVKEGDLIYFNSKMYLNYSFGESNETRVAVGNLTIRKI